MSSRMVHNFPSQTQLQSPPHPLSNLILEPLVKPIYKDSIDKVEEVRSILWNLQNLNKN